ncbi:MAG: hypothetical protein LAN71_00765 [Acidobacteriia bacterium]|nr:hypothetical protein [Terriglobia bacterium]
MSTRKPLALLLASCLLLTPAFGSSKPQAGVIVAAQKAALRNASATAGTTVFHDDAISTDAQGQVQIRAGAARFYLGESSGATLHNEAGMPSATLSRGTAIFATSKSNEFELIASSARIRAQGDTYTVAQVAFDGPHALLITSRRGALTVTLGEETEILPEAASYRVLLEPMAEPEPAPVPQGPRGAGTGPHRLPRRAARDRMHIIPVAVAGAATIFVLHEVFESPNRP